MVVQPILRGCGELFLVEVPCDWIDRELFPLCTVRRIVGGIYGELNPLLVRVLIFGLVVHTCRLDLN